MGNRFFQTRDVQRTPDEIKPAKLVGMRTGETASPLEELARLAKPEELAAFLADVKAKRGADSANVFLQCDNPTCRFTGRFRPSAVAGACPRCNWNAVRQSGHMARLADEEAIAFLKEKERRELAESARLQQLDLNRRNEERAKAGLPALSLAEYRDEINATFRARVERDSKLQAGYSRKGVL